MTTRLGFVGSTRTGTVAPGRSPARRWYGMTGLMVTSYGGPSGAGTDSTTSTARSSSPASSGTWLDTTVAVAGRPCARTPGTHRSWNWRVTNVARMSTRTPALGKVTLLTSAAPASTRAASPTAATTVHGDVAIASRRAPYAGSGAASSGPADSCAVRRGGTPASGSAGGTVAGSTAAQSILAGAPGSGARSKGSRTPGRSSRTSGYRGAVWVTVIDSSSRHSSTRSTGRVTTTARSCRTGATVPIVRTRSTDRSSQVDARSQ